MDHTHYKNKKVLITGGVGFIGSHTARMLCDAGAKVTILDSMIPEYGGNMANIQDIQDRVEINFSDMRDAHSIRHLVKDKDFIFNLAGQVSHTDSMQDPLTDLDINTRAQVTFLETCRKENPNVRIVYSGTRQVYGKPQYLPVDEKHPINPTDANGINTVAGEWYHILYHRVYGMNTCSLRLTNTYGPGQLIKHNRQGFTGTFVRMAVEKKEILLFGTGEQKRDFNYVTDVANALLLAASNKRSVGMIMNLGSDQVYSLKSFAEILHEITGVSYKIVPFPNDLKKIDIGDYYSNYQLAFSTLGWRPVVTLKEGLKKTVEYYKKYLPLYI